MLNSLPIRPSTEFFFRSFDEKLLPPYISLAIMAAYITKASTARMLSSSAARTFTAASSMRSYSTKLARFTSINSINSARAGKIAYRSLSSSARRYEEKLVSGTLQSPSELARKLSEAALPLIPRPDVKKVLVVGSGGLSIGQAGEFDYSGENSISFASTTLPHSYLPSSFPSCCDEQNCLNTSLRSF